MQTRRKFLRDCSLAAALVGVVPAALARPPMPFRVPVAQLGRSAFDRQLNTRFTVRSGPQATELLLVKAAPLPGAAVPEAAAEENFSLIFHGPAAEPISQDTYLLDHPVFGQLPIFIVPVGPAQTTHRCYEAVFNRTTGAAGLAGLISRAPKRARQC
jgi:hypothetical protein